MIARQEIVSDEIYDTLEQEIQENIGELLKRINMIRSAYGQPMIVTSGYRTLEQHLAIYAKKGITDKSKIPMKSKHLYGQAVDISDPGLFVQNWVKENEDYIKKVGLWMEDFGSTPNWVHFQIVPPASKKLYFIP